MSTTTTTTTTRTGPRIYVASLADYNEGRLHGAWVDVCDDLDEMAYRVADMLAAGAPGAEEWAIHDYEGFGGIVIGEHDSLERVAAIGHALEDVDNVGAFVVWYQNEDRSDVEDLAGMFADAYVGEYTDWADFAWELANSTGQVVTPLGSFPCPPASCSSYIDWGAIGRDFRLDGCDFWGLEAGWESLYVFHV